SERVVDAKVEGQQMQYEDALRVWGADRLTAARLERDTYINDLTRRYGSYGPANETVTPVQFDPATVEVKFIYDKGIRCCTTPDPLFYCPQATEPVAEVSISGVSMNGDRSYATIQAREFDFAAVLAEIIAAGGGTVTS